MYTLGIVDESFSLWKLELYKSIFSFNNNERNASYQCWMRNKTYHAIDTILYKYASSWVFNTIKYDVLKLKNWHIQTIQTLFQSTRLLQTWIEWGSSYHLLVSWNDRGERHLRCRYFFYCYYCNQSEWLFLEPLSNKNNGKRL